MSRAIEHVTELCFENDSATIGEVAGGFFRIRIFIEPSPALLDNWKRRRGPNERLLARRWVHFKVLDSTRYLKARDTGAEARIVTRLQSTAHLLPLARRARLRDVPGFHRLVVPADRRAPRSTARPL